MGSIRKFVKALSIWAHNVLVALDQFINALLGGNPDHTISGRVGYNAYITHRWYWRLLEQIINRIFWFDTEHCYKSIEWDEVNTKTIIKK